MEPDGPASSPARPRSWLLVLLGIVVVAALVMKLGGSATPDAPASNPARPAQRQSATKLDPAKLDVQLETLSAARPEPGDSERNPFSFQPKPQPPPPRGSVVPPPVQPEIDPAPVGPQPPTVQPIPLKYIGFIVSPEGRRIASFTDCRATYQAYEGTIIAGQYRLVTIGVESVVVEYVNGTGRTTLPMGGQECVGR